MKMTFLDLMQMKARGEKLPEHIRFEETDYFLEEYGNELDYFYYNEYEDRYPIWYEYHIMEIINKEFEIIDETKGSSKKCDLEELLMRECVGGTLAQEQNFRNNRENELAKKINEIIRYIKTL